MDLYTKFTLITIVMAASYYAGLFIAYKLEWIDRDIEPSDRQYFWLGFTHMLCSANIAVWLIYLIVTA